MNIPKRPGMTFNKLKSSLTQTLLYDRAGDQHYDTTSALHKSIRGFHPDAALYYLARMLQSEDALYIARRLVVVASKDIRFLPPVRRYSRVYCGRENRHAQGSHTASTRDSCAQPKSQLALVASSRVLSSVQEGVRRDNHRIKYQRRF